jgi:hypothetical protein
MLICMQHNKPSVMNEISSKVVFINLLDSAPYQVWENKHLKCQLVVVVASCLPSWWYWDLCINRNNHQKPTFHPLSDFLNPALALLEQGLVLRLYQVWENKHLKCQLVVVVASCLPSWWYFPCYSKKLIQRSVAKVVFINLLDSAPY